MSRFVVVSTIFMGWAFYELSGGADFDPALNRAVRKAETTPEAVPPPRPRPARALSDPVPEPVAAPVPRPAAETQGAAPPTAAEPADLRRVSASNVNLRAGPGTGHAVVARLDEGAAAEVMEIDERGWAHIRLAETGQEGYVAARFLTGSE
ncbi:SH3 domain-containing protein [Maritimibacter sp. 55A14]|uniref:SH3 domain-containing protein n=1 Tax=Maritimibacter sp. 55A14 TaxID=2174844 RepID=UPI00130500C8|nr:SH3 domain-containing protein [Maritimibacter sp. 55A14]